ncbi:MAG: SPOR domain-containing protein [Paludibacteraceae bacterium]|jgi:cell division protein FtsN|nr:SPOR domain-containing protein [Bacteroidaceae bacterium]MBO5862826.1 SPOR domain-containing protein [Paludibacteraceae bacterium]
MKKIILSCLAVAATFVMFSCKSTESSYRAAYEKAKAQEAVAQQTSEPVSVQPVVTTQTPANVDNSNVRSERLNVMNGGTLKAYNVVCGSFKSLDNANNLRNTLVNAGYTAQVAQNPETGMYRVIASSFENKADATVSRDKLRATYKDAWLLYRTY